MTGFCAWRPRFDSVPDAKPPLAAWQPPTTDQLYQWIWNEWWGDHKLPPDPKQLLSDAETLWYNIRDATVWDHVAYLVNRLGPKLVPLLSIADALTLEIWPHSEVPDPDLDAQEDIIAYVAGTLAWARWTYHYAEHGPDLNYANASAWLLAPPPRPVKTKKPVLVIEVAPTILVPTVGQQLSLF